MVALGSNPRWRRLCVLGTLLLLLAVCVVLWGRYSGQWLIVDRPEKADVIVVLAGDPDVRYYRGLELLRAGYGKFMFVDALTRVRFGEPETVSTERFIRGPAGEFTDRIRVCPVDVNSTAGESGAVQACVAPLRAQRLLLVTTTYHSRRALSIFQNRLPQYRWSIAVAVNDEEFGPQWWRKREWAKTYVQEWQKLIWWLAVER